MTGTRYRPSGFLWCVLGLGVALRIPGLGDSFYGDEVFSLLRDSARLVTDTEDCFRPLFFSLLYLWKQLGFHGEIGLRLLPLLFGWLQIPVAYSVGRRLGDERLARVFAVLIACSPMLIEFSQELRMYSLVALLALLQLWAALRALERPTMLRWIAFVAVAAAGVYTHFHYWIFLAGFVPAFIRERKTVPAWQGLAALAATALLYLPNLPHLVRFLAVRGGEYAVHIPSAIPKLLTAFTLGFNYFVLGEQGVGRAVGMGDLARNLPLALLAGAAAVLVLVPLIRIHAREWRDRALHWAHELFTLPAALALIAMLLTHKYWLQPKYLIFSVPFALLFVALAFRSLERVWLRRAVTAMGAAILLVALLHVWDSAHYGRREDWRGLTAYLQKQYEPSSALFALPGNYGLLAYYWPECRSLLQLADVPEGNQYSEDEINRLQARLTTKQRVFYIRWDTVQNLSDPHDALPHALNDIAVAPARITAFNPRFALYEWRLK
ncbi:MAG: glycosyltransferase family 39 protein [bacterium]|nr:glycosyltransferase family 39 protein [bacterium]